MPGDSGFLGEFPLSADRIAVPAGAQLQIEPEAGVLCGVTYDGERAASLKPLLLAAFNDCSIRREGAPKISEKKNWGADSKGVAARLFEVDEIERDGTTAAFRLACFLRRDGAAHEYGVDSALPDYSFYGAQLLDWIVERLNNQAGAADTPLEPVGEYLRACGSPPRVLIGIGATRYTPFGETNFLAPGDESIVVVYDGAVHQTAEVAAAVRSGSERELDRASVLNQLAVAV